MFVHNLVNTPNFMTVRYTWTTANLGEDTPLSDAIVSRLRNSDKCLYFHNLVYPRYLVFMKCQC